ncbi:PRC-barrel domain containing protein [Collinsella sp. AGMB00827]|uniref:PRC-barrel domain containing protein n=1 Tax=Collinsella ureilytica TaxID=2869515 RepID=A0ABS7MKF2_9ACTN|nr:PRC-barrel domain containing protein [Collinsella urealyticum]MBY4797851.1 PRC-barrel domain containing protein [Collinsella urealyticum]
MHVSDFQGVRLYRLAPEGKQHTRDGRQRRPKRLGKIHFPVFSPDGKRLVGFMVSRPDVVGMIKQADLFVALDRVRVHDDLLVIPADREAMGTPAAKRLGVSLDSCLIWTGMDVRSVSGESLGYCKDADCHPKTGEVRSFVATAGSASSALVGDIEIPVSHLKGYRDGAMIVSDAALELEFSGGAAARAAEVTAQVSAGVKKGARVLDEQGSRALDQGSRALGKQLGRTKGMFGAFMSEYKKASRSDETS